MLVQGAFPVVDDESFSDVLFSVFGCLKMQDADGSTYFTFEYPYSREMAKRGYITVDKGSVTVNGVSLTVCEPTDNRFTVAIIPYTKEHTNFCDIKVGSIVNLEFDILGKYIARLREI